MFCIKCGAQIADGSTFCTACGSAVPVMNAQTTTTHVSGGSYVGKVMKYVSGSFKQPAKNVQGLSSEKQLIFLMLEVPKFIFTILAFVFVCLVVSLDMGGAEPLQKAIFESILGDNTGFQILFGILTYIAAYGLMFLMTWVCSVCITKLRVPAVVLLNICSISSVPMIGVLILVMIVGFLWIPLAIMVLLTGVILSAVLYTENIRASGIFGSETAWKNALVLCTATFGTAFFLLLPLAIVF